MKPFIIRGDIQPNHTVVFNTKNLNFKQRAFVRSCEIQLNREPNPQATNANSIAYVMYHNPEDFAATVAVGINDPDLAWQEHQDLFNKKTSKYPQVGFSYTRDEIVELGTNSAGFLMDNLSEGGLWPWPNARAVFQKQGDRLVVVQSI